MKPHVACFGHWPFVVDDASAAGIDDLDIVFPHHLPNPVLTDQECSFLIDAYPYQLRMIQHGAQQPVIARAVHEMLIDDCTIDEAEAL